MTPQWRHNLTYGGTAIVILVVAGLAAVAYRSMRPELPREASIPADVVRPQQATPAERGKTADALPSPAAPGAAAPAGAAADAPKTAAKPNASTPSFDVVRVEPNGDSVVAGRASPDSTVDLLSNGEVAASTKTDSAGQFVMIPKALEPGDHQLTLRTTDGGGHATTSTQVVVVSVPKKPGDQLLVVTEEPGKPAKILSARNAKVPAGTQGAPQVAMASPETSQGAAPGQPGTPATLTADAPATAPRIAAVEAEAGRLFVQGTGRPGDSLSIYLNDAPVAGAVVGQDGKWTLTVRQGLTAGHYQVRVDQLGPDGKVTARAAAPFDYAPDLAAATPASGTAPAASAESAPSAPATLPSDAAKTASAAASPANPVVEHVGTVSIVRGDNLWRISRGIYGRGIRYTVIYAANENQIRDPNLIYPGQVFVVPPADKAGPTAAKQAEPG